MTYYHIILGNMQDAHGKGATAEEISEAMQDGLKTLREGIHELWNNEATATWDPLGPESDHHVSVPLPNLQLSDVKSEWTGILVAIESSQWLQQYHTPGFNEGLADLFLWAAEDQKTNGLELIMAWNTTEDWTFIQPILSSLAHKFPGQVRQAEDL